LLAFRPLDCPGGNFFAALGGPALSYGMRSIVRRLREPSRILKLSASRAITTDSPRGSDVSHREDILLATLNCIRLMRQQSFSLSKSVVDA